MHTFCLLIELSTEGATGEPISGLFLQGDDARQHICRCCLEGGGGLLTTRRSCHREAWGSIFRSALPAAGKAGYASQVVAPSCPAFADRSHGVALHVPPACGFVSFSRAEGNPIILRRAIATFRAVLRSPIVSATVDRRVHTAGCTFGVVVLHLWFLLTLRMPPCCCSVALPILSLFL